MNEIHNIAQNFKSQLIFPQIHCKIIISQHTEQSNEVNACDW